MKNSQFTLLKDNRFLPLFITQFFGAFHDNLFKNALVVLLLYGTAINTTQDPKILVTIAAGIFILPFILFSFLSGQLADKYDKDKIIRIAKLSELAIAGLGSIAILVGSLELSMITLFILGTQSAFFSPAKYSILPQHLKEKELIAGNGLLNTGTFIAILIGTIAGGMLVNIEFGKEIVCALLFACAFFGYFSSRYVPQAPAIAPDLKINYNPISETYKLLTYIFKQPSTILLPILGVSWFYFLGGIFLAQFPNYTNETVGANEQVLTLFLVVFSIGIAIGGLLNNRLLKGRVEALYVPFAAIAITLFTLDLYFASKNLPTYDELINFHDFITYLPHLRIIADIFFIALAGGLFMVPLNAIIQHRTEEKHRARIIAGSAIIDAIFIIASATLSAFLINKGFSINELFLTFAIANGVVATYIVWIRPHFIFKTLLQIIFKIFYNIEIKGLENIEKAGDRAIIVANHVSFLDAPILAAFLPGNPMFAIDTNMAQKWWVKPCLKLIDSFPMDATNPYSTKALIKEIQKDKHCVIFPEGRLTVTGSLMKIYEGPGMIADKSGAMVLPVHLDGVQHTKFTRLKGKMPTRALPKITLTILEPMKFEVPEEIKGGARRAIAAKKLHNVMEDMMYNTRDKEQTLFEALLKARHISGDDEIIAEDVQFKPLSIKDLLRGSITLGKKIANITEHGENVGLMIPNSCGGVVAFFALQAYGRVPAMLNFSAGQASIISTIKTAKIKKLITSKLFIERAKLEETIEELSNHTDIIYLEDLKKQINICNKIMALSAHKKAAKIHKKHKADPNDPALILFTSGSEGMPKGVVLSHKNIMTNIIQLSSRVDFNREDIVFNALPMFHSFGLTGGTLLPILCGVKTFLYPSPLHYRIVPELVYNSNATIMFGTDTFLSGYARMADPYDFYKMRYIFAGAEKVQKETRDTYMEKFGVRILEGYGTTETAPAIAVNSPMHYQAGTVGRILPGMRYKLEPVPGIEEGGRLFVQGDNVMLGYLRADNPGILEPTIDSWHDTGDIVDVDHEGYIKILGRAKRFAKIAGEMVSLTSVESMLKTIYPDHDHAIIAIPDKKKGEQLVMITTNKNAQKKDVSGYASKNGISALSVPNEIKVMDKLPVLGSGKTDYVELEKKL